MVAAAVQLSPSTGVTRLRTPRRCVIACATLVMLTSASAVHAAQMPTCAADGSTLGVARVVEIDTSTGALFGAISTQAREPRFLGPREVVLTFDDGPMPAITRPILDTLDKFCTRATFYSVGRMAIAYPAMTREIVARGHTLGTHTWSHPLNLKRVQIERSREEIEKGHAAVTMAAGQPIAPFFRFPGLSDSGPMLRHLQTRGMAAFTVDVVSNDSYISDPERLLTRTLREVEAQNGGIVLFHDIKAVTARVLPRFLAELKARGFKIVHVIPKATVAPVKDYDSVLAALLAKNERATTAQPLMPFYGRVKPGETGVDGLTARVPVATTARVPVVTIAPVARERAPGPALSTARRVAGRKPGTAVRGWEGRNPGPIAPSAWAPVVLAPR